MEKAEIYVSLKIPDTTAITAFHTLRRMGFQDLASIKRADYYSFEITGSLEDFKNKISKADILVNANKHLYEFSLNNAPNEVNVLVKNSDDDGSGIVSSLKSIGFENIKKASRGVLWTLSVSGKRDYALNYAERIARELLSNEHYQEFKVF